MNESDKNAEALPYVSSIKVDGIRIDVGIMVLSVTVNDHVPLRTSTQIAQFMQSSYPRIAHHSCINSKGPTFAAVIEDTWIAHLLEHLIIEWQVAIAEADYPNNDVLLDAVYAGTTERIGERKFVISLNFKDDLIALEALNNAIRVIDEAISGTDRSNEQHQ